jgi:phage terminase large subunit-like protein
VSEKFHYDKAAADRAVRFFRKCLVHAKGKWAGLPFELLPWQKKCTRDLFGWKRADGTRKYRTAYISVPRKQGKTTYVAGLGIYLTTADGEPGAECYSAAADRDQAAIMFDTAKSMVEASPTLSANITTYRRSMVYPKTASSYKVLSADAPTKHGLNASGILFDELHAQRTRELWDVLTTSTGARRQPLTIAITTAGYDYSSICRSIYEYACGVRDGVIDDPSFYPCIYEAAEEDDWTDPSVWKKANPSFGVTVSVEYFKEEARKAEHSLAYQNTFRRLLLNQWTQQRDRFIDLSAWDGCDAPVDREALRGRTCYGGLDLANVNDINAFVLVFEPEEEDDCFDVLPFFWVPEERLEARAQKDRVPYDAWVRAGFIEATPGNIADHGFIKRRICELRDEFEIAEIPFDRWGSVQIAAQLEDEGFTMVKFGQGFASMSAPTKELHKLVVGKLLRHGGNPVLRWMANNLVVKQDEAGNVKPDKAHSSEKIDGIVALVMGLDRAMRHEAAPAPPSVYEERGVIVV